MIGFASVGSSLFLSNVGFVIFKVLSFVLFRVLSSCFEILKAFTICLCRADCGDVCVFSSILRCLDVAASGSQVTHCSRIRHLCVFPVLLALLPFMRLVLYYGNRVVSVLSFLAGVEIDCRTDSAKRSNTEHL